MGRYGVIPDGNGLRLVPETRVYDSCDILAWIDTDSMGWLEEIARTGEDEIFTIEEAVLLLAAVMAARE